MPFIKPTPLLGNFGSSLLVRKSYAETLQDLYDHFPEERFMGIYQARRPALLVRDPELIKLILIKDFASFCNRTSVTTDTKREPLLRNLANMSGDEWKEFRYKLTPSFSNSKIKAMFPLIFECAKDLCTVLDMYTKLGDFINVPDLMARYATDVIGSCAFGIHTSSLKDPSSPFRKMGRKMFVPSMSNILKRYCRVYFPSLFKVLGLKTYPSDVEQFFLNVVKQVVEERTKSNVGRNDFIELMLKIRNADRAKSGKNEAQSMEISDTLIASNSFIFLLAGLETSSTTLSFCLYELAKNLEIQSRAQQSVDKAIELEGGVLTYEAVNNMSYLNRVVAETLRKHPPTPLTTRLCTETYKIPGSDVQLNVGDSIIIPIYPIHRDPLHYPNPDVFNPDRFTDDVKDSRHSFSYLPLGEGPRHCIGRRFAYVMMGAGLAAVLTKYNAVVCEKTTDHIVYDPRSVLLKNKGGIWLKLEPRH